MSTTLAGQCNCGKVAFELEGPITAIYKCYCTLCQKQSGTASNASTIVRQDDFRWLHGAEDITVWKKDTGFNSHFCSTCGSPVPNPIGEDYVWVPMGLVEPVEATVVVNLFPDDRPYWETSCLLESEMVAGVGDVGELVDALAGRLRE